MSVRKIRRKRIIKKRDRKIKKGFGLKKQRKRIMVKERKNEN